MMSALSPASAFGLGLRSPHYDEIIAQRPELDFLEVISENFIDTEGKPRRTLQKFRELYPIALHGVSLSIGTVDPLHSEYLRKLKALIREIQPRRVSDHLCWTGVAHKNTHDLLPVPYTEEALRHIIKRITQVQDFLETPIALENPSTYLEFQTSELSEAEFMTHMVNESGCDLLLDVNNVYVTCFNHRLNAKNYIDTLPLHRVKQIHLAGHDFRGTHIIDTHDAPVSAEVIDLYKYTVKKINHAVDTMIERDDEIPPFAELYAELQSVKAIAAETQTLADPQQKKIQTAPITVRGEMKPAKLNELQDQLQASLLTGACETPEDWITPKENFSAAEQLAVYQNAYRIRLLKALQTDFPGVKKYLGEESYNKLLQEYVLATPSRHFNLARYGEKFPDFLRERLPEDRFAQEMAAFDYAILAMADEAESEALSFDHIKDFTPEILLATTLSSRAALRLFHFRHNINEYYQAEHSPAITEAESFVTVFRHEDIVWRMALEKAEYYLLQNLFAGSPVGAALESLAEQTDLPEAELPAFLTRKFKRWIENGVLRAAAESN